MSNGCTTCRPSGGGGSAPVQTNVPAQERAPPIERTPIMDAHHNASEWLRNTVDRPSAVFNMYDRRLDQLKDLSGESLENFNSLFSTFQNYVLLNEKILQLDTAAQGPFLEKFNTAWSAWGNDLGNLDAANAAYNSLAQELGIPTQQGTTRTKPPAGVAPKPTPATRESVPLSGSTSELSRQAEPSAPIGLSGAQREIASSSTEVITLTAQNFDQEVRNSDVPVVVDFMQPTEYCPACGVVSGYINELNSSYAGEIKFGMLNIRQDPSFMATYGVQLTPTAVIFKNGLYIAAPDDLMNAPTKEGLRDWINSALSQYPNGFQPVPAQ